MRMANNNWAISDRETLPSDHVRLTSEPAIKLRTTKLHLSRLVTSTDDKVWKHGWEVLANLRLTSEEKLWNQDDRSRIC